MAPTWLSAVVTHSPGSCGRTLCSTPWGIWASLKIYQKPRPESWAGLSPQDQCSFGWITPFPIPGPFLSRKREWASASASLDARIGQQLCNLFTEWDLLSLGDERDLIWSQSPSINILLTTTSQKKQKQKQNLMPDPPSTCQTGKLVDPLKQWWRAAT